MSARAQLVRREQAGAGARGALIALHADGADSAELLPLCAALAFGRLALAPQAPRARNPFLSSAPPDDARWRDYAGFSWFRRDERGFAEPASFGDSLAQLELLALELHERGAAPVVLLGRREGGALALAARRTFPDLLDAVVALDAEPDAIPDLEADERSASVPLLELECGADPLVAVERVREFLNALRGDCEHGRSREQETDQDLLQAHRLG